MAEWQTRRLEEAVRRNPRAGPTPAGRTIIVIHVIIMYLLSWWNGRHAVLRRRCPEAGVRVQISAGAPPIITSVWCSGSAPLALTQETLVRIQQPKPPWTGSSVWSEHSTDNREVAGSIPARSTIINEQNDVLAEWLMQRPAKPRSTVRFRDTSPLFFTFYMFLYICGYRPVVRTSPCQGGDASSNLAVRSINAIIKASLAQWRVQLLGRQSTAVRFCHEAPLLHIRSDGE